MAEAFYPFVGDGTNPTPSMSAPTEGSAGPTSQNAEAGAGAAIAEAADVTAPLAHHLGTVASCPARIAVFDDPIAAPRVVVVQPSDIRTYLEEITATVTRLATEQGGSISFTVIREVVENFVHAYCCEPTISILDGGNTIRFSDQGPGIAEKDKALQYGTTSATEEMKRYIRGVGSGLPYARQYMRDKGGELTIEDNMSAGTVVTLSMPHATMAHEGGLQPKNAGGFTDRDGEATTAPVPGATPAAGAMAEGITAARGATAADAGAGATGAGIPGQGAQAPGYPQPAYAQTGYAQQTYPQQSLQPTPYPQQPYQPYPTAYPQQAYPQPAYPQPGYPQPGYVQPPYPITPGAPGGLPHTGPANMTAYPQVQPVPGTFAAAQAQPMPSAFPPASTQPVEITVTERGRMVLSYLTQHESVGPTELEHLFGGSLSTWSRQLNDLEQKGLLKKEGQKRFLTDAGRAFAVTIQ